MGMEWIGTFLSDVLDFDGVGFAIEPEDWIVWRHCGGFTSHREGMESARDEEAREGERGNERDEPAVRSGVSSWR
jgi:hypothetical protein